MMVWVGEICDHFNPHFMKSGLGGARQIFGRCGRFLWSGRDEILVGGKFFFGRGAADFWSVWEICLVGARRFSYFNFSPLTTDKKKWYNMF